MKILAVTNIKGGVGKTTTVVNLAYLCAASRKRTLLWDLDPQGGATYILGIDPDQHEFASARKLLAGKCDVPELIVGTGYSNLDLLPANLSYRKFDIHLNDVGANGVSPAAPRGRRVAHTRGMIRYRADVAEKRPMTTRAPDRRLTRASK